MASNVKIKRSSTSGKIPLTTDLQLGELAVNTFDGKLYLKKNNGTDVIVEIGASTGGGSTSSSWVKKTANYTAVSGDKLLADTSAGTFTITLPASPTTGNSVVLADGADWYTTNLTVARNSQTIEGATEDLVLNIKGIQLELIFDGTTWEVFAATGPSEGFTGSNALIVNNHTQNTSQTIKAGTSALTIGPYALAPGATLTVEAGARHVII
jgi:hypothetical protein